MIVKVTAEDIKEGCQFNSKYCPIALAIQRAAPDAEFVSVGNVSASISGGSKAGYYELPKAASNFVRSFDTTKSSVKPATFRLQRVS